MVSDTTILTDRLTAPVSRIEWHLVFGLALAGSAIPYLITILVADSPAYEMNPVAAYVIFELGWNAAAGYKIGLLLLVFAVGWWAAGRENWAAARAAVWPFTILMVYNTVVDLRTWLLAGTPTTLHSSHTAGVLALILVSLGATIVYGGWLATTDTPQSRSKSDN